MDGFKKRRQSVKAAMTRIHKYCTNPDVSFDEVKVRVVKLDELFKQFEEIQLEIDSLTKSPDEVATEEIYRSEIEESYFAAKTIVAIRAREDEANHTVVENAAANTDMTTAMQTLMENQSTMALLLERISTNSRSGATSTSLNINEQHQNSLKLPSIQIPEFDGTYVDWIRFRDLFEAMIHNKLSLSGVEKFEYLQTRLKGDALSLVKHLRPTNENYQIAWDLLTNKYNKSDQIKKAYFELLFDQPSINSPVVSEIKRLFNNSNETISALKALEEPVEHWDSILLFHMEKKLDPETMTLWCRERKSESVRFQQFLDFLEQRLLEVESAHRKRLNTQNAAGNRNRNQSGVHTTLIQSCPVCSEQHLIFQCTKFKSLNVDDRGRVVRNNNLCFNCLQANHRASDCQRSSCKMCKAKHNTLLHRASAPSNEQRHSSQKPDTPIKKQTLSVAINSFHQNKLNFMTLLPTAVVMVQDGTNHFQPCRVLLDSGAQATLITEACAQRLELKRTHDQTVLYGIGSTGGCNTRGEVKLSLKSSLSNKIVKADAFCLSTLTQNLPAHQICSNKLEYFQKLNLADPSFDTPSHIDIILGADMFSECVLPKTVVHPTGSPCAMSTIFGWVLVGKIAVPEQPRIWAAHVSFDFSEQLHRFWEIEEIQSSTQFLTDEEQQAERHYQQNVQRDATGRYIVRLPFKTDERDFGDTKSASVKRLYNMERRFQNDKLLEEEYNKFIQEYIDLSHMELSLHPSINAGYYMPHHAVIKPSSTTTKLRVVFDASCKGSNGVSLNDRLIIGPTVQNDLFTILLKFRKYKIGFCSDIEKMYRQVLVHVEDRLFRGIVWRTNKHEAPKTYNLKTITYGTAAAPFLATRTLKQVGNDCSESYPTAAESISQCFYVDDFMSCATDLGGAIKLKDDLCDVLSSAGFHLRKWCSNAPQFLATIDQKDRESSSETVIDESQTVKTLGLLWDTAMDAFKYSVYLSPITQKVSKRTTLSDISKIFDPIGWLAPVVVSLKIFMQKLWLKGICWDQSLPEDILNRWIELRNSIALIPELRIPRWLQFSDEQYVEIHGFADSSELAYAAAIYLRVIRADGSISTSLIASKTRVAPVKQVTLPRLELCAAHLMAKLVVKIQDALNIQHATLYGWSDSTIVLSWIADHPRRWKNFIANRTSYIISVIPAQQWHHISSQENPADVATRGTSPSELINNQLWWHGPPVLRSLIGFPEHSFEIPTDVDMEERKNVIVHVSTKSEPDLIDRFSHFNKLLRITALLLSFSQNCQPQRFATSSGFLTSKDLQSSHTALIKREQQKSFASEICVLVSSNQLPANHKLAALAPFIDDNGLLRVGGRLENANISYDQKHPLILSKDSHLTELIVKDYHYKYLHAGCRQLQYLLGLKYWIPSVIYVIKRCVYKCTRCMRFRGKPFEQQMGNLPQQRLETVSAFVTTGVDFAGPLQIRSWKGRGSKLYKCWISIFICLTTKAIHLELVTELSTAAFLATLRRFIARRGRPAHIFSDNGTNFVGCNQKLRELLQFMQSSTTKDSITREMSQQHIQWHFSPPVGPHFGGLWEAGVKSTKFHLNRVLSDASATFEEMHTVLCQIEGCLNSRPLCAKFEGDMDPLTPAHFLIFRPMSAVPDESNLSSKINHLNRWQHLQRLVSQFWKRWSTEYLTQLQKRPKWNQKLQNLQCNDLVIIKDDNLPPTQWSLGKIIDTHSGADGLVRVVTVKTAKGCHKRPIVKLCPLFVDI